ncbi:MAG: Tat pathway signal protein [Halanaeroarchaeum sp.]
MTTLGPTSGVSRRSFLKGAVAVGGTTGLTACVRGQGSASVPPGTDDFEALPERQHAWNQVLRRDDDGNALLPRHHVLASFSLPTAGRPGASARDTVETALRTLERAYERSPAGLLFTVSYSPRYFDRFDGTLPQTVDLPRPRPLAPFEDPALDEPDVLIHLASDIARVPLEAEAALRGTRDVANGVSVDVSLSSVLDSAGRRTGFVGAGLPAKHEDVADVPSGTIDEDAPLFMGFKSGFAMNQASEDRVTIEVGPFRGGTTQHLSQMTIDLHQWYEQDDRFQRVAKMFSPTHAEEGLVEDVGQHLGKSSKMSAAASPWTAAREWGVVGHSQKLQAVREDGSPLLLRRDFSSTDGDRPGLHFLALQEGIEDFVRTRTAMNGTDLASETPVGTRLNNGILQYLTVLRRGNFLVPPRRLRALPPADPGDAGGES